MEYTTTTCFFVAIVPDPSSAPGTQSAATLLAARLETLCNTDFILHSIV